MITDYTLNKLYEDRLHDAARAYAHAELIRAASGEKTSLFQQVRQRVHLPSRQPQSQIVAEIRPAHAT